MPTGIEGLDDCRHVGLPQRRNTLIMGGPGSGKTVLALRTPVNGARQRDEPGIFVAFDPQPLTRRIGDRSERDKVLAVLDF